MPVRKNKSNKDTPHQKTHWLSTSEVAEMIGVEYRTIEGWRTRKWPGQPPFTKHPGKQGRVQYKLEDINAWLESRIHEFAGGEHQ